jgi:peptide/nickel transport system ATP-binding protein
MNQDGQASAPLLRLSGIERTYELREPGGLFGRKRVIAACDGVDLEVEAGEIVSLVGESGSGKSTLARIALMLERPDAGSVEFEGVELTKLNPKELRAKRRWIQVVFQDSLSSLNPRWRIGRSIRHPLEVHGDAEGATEEAVAELLDLVELPRAFALRFPHEVSGGQRQRACIARALALQPRLLVADEAVSSLDVSTQARILELLRNVRDEFGTAILFIAHDLRIVRHLSSRVAVMRGGKIVEFRSAEDLYRNPQAEYTRALIQSVIGARYQPNQEVFRLDE